MSNLILVRHGQASFGAENYDQLSPLGEKQAATLGYYWANQGVTFNQVYVGPLQRHIQTWEAARTAYEQHGSQLPDPITLAAFDEHQGMQTFEDQLLQLAERQDRLGELTRAVTMAPKADENEDETRRNRLRAYLHFTHLWATAEITSDRYESWADFCLRVEQGLKTITEQAESKQQLVVFTSGGVIAAVLRFALGLTAEKAIALNGTIRNGSYTTFRFSNRENQLRISLNQFNAYPHLDNDALLTYI